MKYDKEQVIQAARGREVDVLVAAGFTPEQLDGNGHPCPRCGGRDRFCFNRAKGYVHCRSCFSSNNGDLLAAVQWIQQTDFPEALRFVARCVGCDSSPHAHPKGGSSVNGGADKTPKNTEKQEVVSTSTGKNLRRYTTAKLAIESLDKQLSKQKATRTQAYTYRNGDGHPVAVVCRYDMPGQGKDGKPPKTFRPVFQTDSGEWQVGAPPDLRPLYRLDELSEAGTVFVVEGEKCADAACELGLQATTSMGGAKNAAHTDWTPLAGKSVVVVPDNDTSGHQYGDQVASVLMRLHPPAKVKQVFLPGLPSKGDLVNWLQAHTHKGKQWILESIDEMVDNVEFDTLHELETEQQEPFPVDAMPEPVASFIRNVSESIGCDPCYVALPALSVLASAIGNSTRIQLKRGWTEPSIVWTVIVGLSGTMKSPALEFAVEPIKAKQVRQSIAHHREMAAYEESLASYEREYAAWKRSKGIAEPPEKPQEPVLQQLWSDDATIESLAVLLLNQPRGLLVPKDELAGWLNGFDRYSKGSSEAARWLEFHGGRSVLINRKTGHPKTIFIPRAAVSVTGGIQPSTLKRSLSDEYRESGLAARLLLAIPPRMPKHWRETEVSDSVLSEYAYVIDRLMSLQPAVDADGLEEPQIVRLTDQARTAWIEFYNRHAKEQSDLSGDLAAAYAKLEGYAARFALIVQAVRWAAGDGSLNRVDRQSIEAGVRLCQWFAGEAQRIYRMLDESTEQSDVRELLECIRRRGGEITARELMRSSRSYPNSQAAEAALNKVVATGQATWETRPPSKVGGRPMCVCRIISSADADTTSQNPGKTEVLSAPKPKVDAPVGGEPVSADFSQWGEL